jgi:hypothetical protein
MIIVVVILKWVVSLFKLLINNDIIVLSDRYCNWEVLVWIILYKLLINEE